MVGYYELIPGTQFGERSNCSIINAAMIFIYDVERGKRNVYCD